MQEIMVIAKNTLKTVKLAVIKLGLGDRGKQKKLLQLLGQTICQTVKKWDNLSIKQKYLSLGTI
jgi:hypothetical protein